MRFCAALLLCACGGATPRPEPRAAEEEPAPEAADVVGLSEGPAACALHAEPLATDASAAWGDVRPGVFLFARGEGHEVFFPAGYNGPFHRARLGSDGALTDEREVAPFAALGEASYPHVASEGDVVVAASAVYVQRQNADVYLAIRRGDRWGPPIVIADGPELQSEVVVALQGNRAAVLWQHGDYPMNPNLSVAMVDLVGGTVLHRESLGRANPEGTSIVPVPEGWLVVYTPSSASGGNSRGLELLRLDRDGAVQGRKRLLQGPALWPIAARRGDEVGIAFRARKENDFGRARGVVGFMRVGLDGEPKGEWVVADRHPDPLAGFRPLSLFPSDEGWWLASTASFTASVMIARAGEGRVARLAPDGEPIAATAVGPEETGASILRIVPHGDGVRGVYVQDRGDRRFRAVDVGCTTVAPDAEDEDRCAPRITEHTESVFEALRGYWEHAVDVDGDLIVGYREMVRDGRYTRAGEDVHVARLRADGRALWHVSLGAGYHPRLAHRSGVIAVLTSVDSGSPLELTLLDANDGAQRSRRRVSSDASTACIGASASGWVVAQGPPFNQRGQDGFVQRLRPDGTSIGSATSVGSAFNSCDVRERGGTIEVAYTHPGRVSETNHLFVRRLGAPEKRVEDVHFARSPQFYGDRLLFGGPLGRNLSSVHLAADLSPSEVESLARTYGFRGWAIWGGELVWSTDEHIARRGCL